MFGAAIKCLGWMAIGALLMTRPAEGALVAAGTGAQNTTMPSGIPAWNNVGLLSSGGGITDPYHGSSVYLGDRWVLTANHIGSFPNWIVNLNGTNYFEDVNTPAVSPVSASGVGSDLVLKRLTVDPGLPAVVIGASPAAGTHITFMGYGSNRDPALTTWDASSNPWVESNQGSPLVGGYKWLGTSSKRWATNKIDSWTNKPADLPPTVLNRASFTYSTDYSSAAANNASGATSSEGTVVGGDSGGGVFDDRNRLIGINLYRDSFTGQPDNTSVFGGYSYFADIATYADDIAFKTKWAPSLIGDANLDGYVNNADFKILYNNFGTGTHWSQGDFDLDGIVDFNDYQLFERNFGLSYTAPLAGSPFGDGGGTLAGVPEPGGLSLLVIGALAALRRRTK